MKSDKLTFGILGGDKRNYYLAKALKNDGYEVKLCGFEKLSNMSCEVASALDSDVLVLPIIPFDKGKEVKSPYAEKTVDLSEKFLSEFSGMEKETLSYSDREEFSVKNAVPTAEGAIEKAINSSDFTINGSKSLVCGYGRIGKVLSEMLRGMGSEVTVSARKSSDLAWIKLNSFQGVKTGYFSELEKYDLIFNTVPAMIFDEEKLKRIKSGALIIDLASYPGGVDFEKAKELGVKTIHALSLPGKVAPKSAGEIIESTILSILKEDDG